MSSGVKQGCVLSPGLFNLVMNDLETMLDVCEGVKIKDTKITGLFYADDIILMAGTKDGLTHMIQVADNFCTKWGMSFNEKKSQVMVIGQKYSSEAKWKLGDKLLSEAKIQICRCYHH